MSGTRDNIYVAIVDDDPSICRSLARLLRASNIQPIAYESAEAFLQDHKQPRFDCLLLDVQLEGMSGLDLCQRLNAQGSNVPVLFITAHDDPEAEARAYALNCKGYFRKNTFGSEILDAIHRLCGNDAPAVASKEPRPPGAAAP